MHPFSKRAIGNGLFNQAWASSVPTQTIGSKRINDSLVRLPRLKNARSILLSANIGASTVLGAQINSKVTRG